MIADFRQLTIKEIEVINNINYTNNNEEEYSSPLSEWYAGIRNKKICELTDGDICICIRQDVYLKYTILEALERLYINPTIGEFYDFEVLKMICRVDKEFWLNNSEVSDKARDLVRFLKGENVIIEDYVWFDENEFAEYNDCVKLLSSIINLG